MATKYQWIRRLRRELTASPKKAAVLSTLLLVAAWFWTPLLGKWFGSKTPEDGMPQTATTDQAVGTNIANNMPADVSTTDANPTNNKLASPKWQQILSWIRNDPHMKPHPTKFNSRDPFAPAASKIAAREEHSSEPGPAPSMTPQQAGIVVRSTVVGGHTRTALINGRAYHEQQNVIAPNGHDRFVLAEIRPTAVVLDRNGQRYEVKIRMVEAAALEE